MSGAFFPILFSNSDMSRNAAQRPEKPLLAERQIDRDLLVNISDPSRMASLLCRGAGVNAQRVGGKTALMLACSSANLRAVQVLLAAPPPQVADVDRLRDRFGKTALHYALASCGGAGTAEQRAAAADAHPVVRALRAHLDAHCHRAGSAVPAPEAAAGATAAVTETRQAAAGHQLDAWRPCAAVAALSSDTGSSGGCSSDSGSGSDDDR
jgi:hypothetical protein